MTNELDPDEVIIEKYLSPEEFAGLFDPEFDSDGTGSSVWDELPIGVRQLIERLCGELGDVESELREAKKHRNSAYDRAESLKAENERLKGQMKFPWQSGKLMSWSIVGMNHYRVNGVQHTFVAMTNKDARVIQAEGSNVNEVFLSLEDQA